MRKSRFNEEQIVMVLKEADAGGDAVKCAVAIMLDDDHCSRRRGFRIEIQNRA